MQPATLDTQPRNDANRLGLDYRAEAERLPWTGPIVDVHTHINSAEAAALFFQVADLYGIDQVWSMSPLEQIDALRQRWSDRLRFIAVPNYAAREQPETFTTDWLRRIERFAEKGVRMIKFWAAPRGRDYHSDALLLGSPTRRRAMKLAYELGYRVFMTHVADPDTWFQTRYVDAAVYGTKAEQYEPLEELLAEYRDVTWIAAHMAGNPEDLEFVQGLLDRHPNLVVDTSATKWMVRELSKHPAALRRLCQRNRGRVLFGSDIVATTENGTFDLYASRYWALRTLFETSYDGPSPIVDPDLALIDPQLDEKSTPDLRGAALDGDTLASIYAAAKALPSSPAGAGARPNSHS